MLPKVKQSIIEITIPSSEKKMKFRPFLVKEEKILLTAEQSGDVNELILAIKQVINNCVLGKLDVEDLPLFDIEYIFIKLRARSVSNISEIVILDKDDNRQYKFDIDLDKLEITKVPGHTNKIKLDGDIGIVMKYPSIKITETLVNTLQDKKMSAQDIDFFIIKECVANIFDSEKVYEDFTDEELTIFLESLNHQQSEKIAEFFNTLPVLKHEVSYTNSLGELKVVKFDGIGDFFQ